MERAVVDLIRVFDCDPDLLEGLDEPTAEHLRLRLAVRRDWAEPGTWRPDYAGEDLHGHLGLLVVEGLLVRTLRLGGRECSEVVGPGDLLRPWDAGDDIDSVECENEWRVLQTTAFAVLDQRFALLVARWPTITAELLGRSARRCRTVVYQAAIAHVRHAETRVLVALWHLADRWGSVTAEGVVVPVPLTHQLLAQLTCLQRPTVSGALSRLTAAGRVSRIRDGGWILHGEPPRLTPAHETELVAV